MKVYVDNYTKVSSWIWDFDKEKGEFCLKINFSSLDWDEPLNLLSLAYHDKQVRKEVCEKFVEQFMIEYTMGNEPVEDIIYKVADQIQGETDAKD